MRILFVLTFFLSLFFNLSSQDNDLYRMMKDRNEFYFSFYFDLHGLDKISNLISIDKITVLWLMPIMKNIITF